MHRIKLVAFSLVIVSNVLSPLAAQRNVLKKIDLVPIEVRKAAETITERELRELLGFFASDEMERFPGMASHDAAAKFIAMNLSRSGIKPAGDKGTYFQSFGVRNDKLDLVNTFSELDGKRYEIGADYHVNFANEGTVSGALVYVGHGYVNKAKNIDSFRDVDVRDKIVVIGQQSNGAGPKGLKPADFVGKRGEDWEIPIEAAIKRGAKAIMRLPNVDSLSTWWGARESLKTGDLIADELAVRRVPDFTVSFNVMDDILTGEKIDTEQMFRRIMDNDPIDSFEFASDKRFSFNTKINSRRFKTQNVVGMIEGSDSTLKHEVVVFQAHYDVGKQNSALEGDGVHNGADDNGSGTVGTLAIAKAFMTGPRPRRSILFLWDTAEEQGLLGTLHFIKSPPVHLKNIVLLFNIDMIGRSAIPGVGNPNGRGPASPNSVYVAGPKTLSSELYEIFGSINRSYLNMEYGEKYDEAGAEFNWRRGDHVPFLHNGVPTVAYFTGIHSDYHLPTDSAEKIDYSKMEKIARTIYVTAHAIANAPKRPIIDKPFPDRLKNPAYLNP